MKLAGLRRGALRTAGMLAICFVSLQIFFVLRIAVMIVVDPHSTSFQRSDAWRLVTHPGSFAWRREWVGAERISQQLKRAVIASEDARFYGHSGVEWDSIERAWERNREAQARFESASVGTRKAARSRTRPPRLVGGSTISQQLAKNLFLSAERTLPRKVQEFAITLMLEALLGKERILEIYLNSVEWGQGLYGAEAAARHYHRVAASQLNTMQAARMAVMLPAPKRFEKRPVSPYVTGRAAAIAARMNDIQLP